MRPTPGGLETDSGRTVRTTFPEKREASRGRQASTRREGQTEVRTPYLPSNLSVVIFQSLIQLTCGFTIGKTIMSNFVEPALLVIIADFAPVDSIFWRVDSKNFAEKFQRAFAVAFKICEYLPHVEVPFSTETARVQQKVARYGHPHNRTANIDVGEIKGLPIERHETLRPDLADVGPEIGE